MSIILDTENPNGVIHADGNREPMDVLTAAIDLNAPDGLVVDANGTKADYRGENTAHNDDAEALIEASEADPEADWIGDRQTADAINLPQSVYLVPALDAKDPEDLEQSEPPPDPEPVPPLDAGLLRSI